MCGRLLIAKSLQQFEFKTAADSWRMWAPALPAVVLFFLSLCLPYKRVEAYGTSQ